MNSTPKLDILSEFNKVISFWPVFLVSFILSMIFLFAYIRYTDEIYDTSAKILVLDDAQESFANLNQYGIIIFDDFLWEHQKVTLSPTFAILKFLKKRLDSLCIFFASPWECLAPYSDWHPSQRERGQSWLQRCIYRRSASACRTS